MRHVVGMLVASLLAGILEARAGLGEEIHAILKRTGYDPSEYTVLITGLDDSDPIFEYNTTRDEGGLAVPVLRPPASLQKILLTTTAIEKFGVNHQFATEIRQAGDDLCLVGLGDPTLSTKALQTMAKSIRQAGYSEIKGRLILDESMFPGNRPYSEDFEADFDKPHAGFIGALSLNENRVSMSAKPGKTVGDPARISTYPELFGLSFANRTKTVKYLKSKRVGFSFSQNASETQLVSSGSIGLNQSKGVWVSQNIEDPAQFTGRAFLAEFLSPMKGLPEAKFSGKIERRVQKSDFIQCDTENSRTLYVQNSVALGDILRYMNQTSVNFVAEMIMMAMADRYPCNERNQEICDWLYYKAAIENDTFYPVRPSGLYRDKVIDAWMLRDSMVAANRLYGASFVENLGRPGVGDEGWIRRYFQGEVKLRPSQHIYAKTGSIRNVQNLAGFGIEDGKSPFVFVFFFENDPSIAKVWQRNSLSPQQAMEHVIHRVFESR